MPTVQACIFFGYLVVTWIYTTATLWNHPPVQ